MIRQQAKTSDVIIVLGGGIKGKKSLPDRAALRVSCAVELYRKGLAPRMLFSGKHSYVNKKHRRRGSHMTEARAMADYALRLGVPRQAIILEEKSQDTLGNFHYCNKILNEKRWTSAIVVTSRYHVRRARYIAQRLLHAKAEFIGARTTGRKLDVLREHLTWLHLRTSRIPWNNIEPYLMKKYAHKRISST